MSALQDSEPLQWPLGRPRTPQVKRKHAKFSVGDNRAVTIDAARSRLKEVMRLLKADGIVITTNIKLRRDGLPRSGQGDPSDPGVAVYFRLNDQQQVVACDQYKRLPDNLAAIAAHLDAMRDQARWGCGSLAQAFAGYKALTAADAIKSWWTVLGFDKPPERWSTVVDKHTELLWRHHPDRGGDQGIAAAINAARDEARAFYAEVSL